MSAEHKTSPKIIGGLTLMGLSFVPFAASFAVLASDSLTARAGWLTVALIISSNVLWYLGILIIGPDVYKAMRKRWRARRRRKEQVDDPDTGSAGSDRVGALGASSHDQQ